MSDESFPYIPPELIQKLDQMYPNKSPQSYESEVELRWRGGQRSVVEKLIAVAKDQKPRNR